MLAVVVLAVAALVGPGWGPAPERAAAATVVSSVEAQAFVRAAYDDFLARAPTSDELSFLAAALTGGALTRAGLVGVLASSEEWVATVVDDLYQDTLGRDGDAAGVAYWTGLLRAGTLTVAQVAASFYASDEYFAGLGGGTVEGWVTDLYAKILLRAPDAAGLAYWVAQTSAVGRVTVAYAFFQSSESAHTRVAALYHALLGRDPDPGGWDYWSVQVVAEGDLALAAALAASDEYWARARSRYPGYAAEGPVVLTGNQLSPLLGTAPGRIVAFRRTTTSEVVTWTQLPVQVDQRKVVPFGSAPADNAEPGTTGTVYGSGTGGPTALQYADPDTWVGADGDPSFDGDDELVFMASDAGDPVVGDPGEPAGVVPGTGVQVVIGDPRADGELGRVYLFRSDGSLDPAAGEDYVDYRFELASGDYQTTYLRAVGPNPETSYVVTPTYRIGFADRWKETSWQVSAGGATGVDVLDGNKDQFAPDDCGRSNETFAAAEGAFVANIDGPVRAIRSYVGANSGPLTERTHLLYRDREDVITDLRVHAIASIMDFVDYSAGAGGMTYRSSTVPGGITIDGVPDAVGTTLPAWEAVDGPQGRIYTRGTVSSSQPGLAAATGGWYADQLHPAAPECWGDGAYYGASGLFETAPIGNTDPRSVPYALFRVDRVNEFLTPSVDPSAISADAAVWAGDVGTALSATVSAWG